MFATPIQPTIATNRLRQQAGNPHLSRKQTELPEGVTISCLHEIFTPLEEFIKAEDTAAGREFDSNSLNAIRTCNARVLIKWTEEDEVLEWKSGWYCGTVKRYLVKTDEIEVKCASEPNHFYRLKIEESVKGTLQLNNNPTVEFELYDQLTEIGARVLIKWSKEVLQGTNWRPGWYATEIQTFTP